MSFENYIKKQQQLHPAMTPQDAVKLCFQAAFGAEHILQDKASAYRYLTEEYEKTEAEDMMLYEPICDTYARCNLAAWKYAGLPLEQLFTMFCDCANGSESGDCMSESFAKEAVFRGYLDVVTDCAGRNVLLFEKGEWEKYKNSYLADGIRPVHHSEHYRQCEKPAYRLVRRTCIKE